MTADAIAQAGETEASPTAEVPATDRSKTALFIDCVVALVIAACVLVVHDVPYLLRTPYWIDEAWVAVSTRMPLGSLPRVTWASPIGWTFLLRLVPGSGQQDQRLLPLLFAGLTVLAAYAFGRTLNLLPIVTGALAAAAALLVPAMLVRDDLKEYTADAFVIILGLALVSALEANWSRRRLALLAAAIVACSLVSHISLFVGAAVLPCVVVAQLARRQWSRALEATIATVCTGLSLGLVFLTLDRGTRGSGIRAYWHGYYLPHSVSGAAKYVNHRVQGLLPYFGIAHAWILFLLVLLGLGVLAWQGRFATAALLPAIFGGLVILSALHDYPLLDERTSTFLITASLVIAAVGVAGIATLLARRVHPLAGVAIAAAAAAAFLPGALPFVDTHRIPVEDVRSQAAYVEAHAGPDDVVLVSRGAAYGYGYYGKSQPGEAKLGGGGFVITYPPSLRVIVVTQGKPAYVTSGFDEARQLLSGHPGARLWLVINHVSSSSEAGSWLQLMRSSDVHDVQVAAGTHVGYIDES